MTNIQWTDEVWNPVTGCSHVSAGRKNCYAEFQAWPRLSGNPHLKDYHGRDFGDVRCHPERLEIPYQWKKPRRIFVNSMSDLFHPDVPEEFIGEVFGRMVLAEQHTFQVLTKRPERMRELMLKYGADGKIRFENEALDEVDEHPFPLPNVWLGVSVEDQRTADERIPLLLQTPAAVRFVSYEPALGPVIFFEKDEETGTWKGPGCFIERGRTVGTADEPSEGYDNSHPGLDWLIAGGESGPGARPCDVEWIRSVVRQGKAAGVPVFVKQLGANVWFHRIHDEGGNFIGGGKRHLNDSKGGDPSEWPEDLRVREWPR